VIVEPFKGYGPQKQSAIDKAVHDWVLLLDADEFLAEGAQALIESELQAPRAQGYRLPRREWLFWRWPHPATRPNWQLRLFRRSCGAMNAVPVHAAPEVRGPVLDLPAEFRHYGEPELAVRVDKINRYSSGLVAHKRASPPACPACACCCILVGLLPLLRAQALLPQRLGGYFAARSMAFYAFLKYAKRARGGAQGSAA
jgi:hypothetical protein